jgi:hypothetical protein
LGKRCLCTAESGVRPSHPPPTYVNAGLLTVETSQASCHTAVRFDSSIDTKMRLVMPCAVQAQAATRTQKGEVDSCHFLYCGYNSVVEFFVANEVVVSSNLTTRSNFMTESHCAGLVAFIHLGRLGPMVYGYYTRLSIW